MLALDYAPAAALRRGRALALRVRDDSLLRNSVYIMATTVVTSALGYVYWVVAAHLYAARDVGLASSLISVMTFVASLANLGVGSALTQALPKRAAGAAWSATVNAACALVLASGLVAGAVVALALPRLSPQLTLPAHPLALAVSLVAGVALWNLSALLDSVFIAERAAGQMLLRNGGFALLKIPLLVLPLGLAGIGALNIFASWVIAAGATFTAGMVLLVPRLRRTYRPGVAGIAEQARALIGSLAGHHFANVGGTAPMYLLPVIIATRLAPAQSAYFYTTWMLGSLFFMISSSVASSLFAEGSHAAADLRRQVRASARIIAALLAPTMLVFLLGGRLILAIFGASYAANGLPILVILVVAAVPDAITNVYVSALRVRRRLGMAAGINLGMAAVALALAWVLLPSIGVVGAAWAWMAGQLAGCLFVAGSFGLARLRAYSAGTSSSQQTGSRISQ